MRRLVLPEPAQDDLLRVRHHLTHPNAGPRASRRIEAIVAAVADLLVHPCRWPLSLHHRGLRRRSVEGGYAIIYEVEPDTGDDRTAGDVTILAAIFPGENRTR